MLIHSFHDAFDSFVSNAFSVIPFEKKLTDGSDCKRKRPQGADHQQCGKNHPLL